MKCTIMPRPRPTLNELRVRFDSLVDELEYDKDCQLAEFVADMEDVDKRKKIAMAAAVCYGLMLGIEASTEDPLAAHLATLAIRFAKEQCPDFFRDMDA